VLVSVGATTGAFFGFPFLLVVILDRFPRVNNVLITVLFFGNFSGTASCTFDLLRGGVRVNKASFLRDPRSLFNFWVSLGSSDSPTTDFAAPSSTSSESFVSFSSPGPFSNVVE
jgi:hypothetical protein